MRIRIMTSQPYASKNILPKYTYPMEVVFVCCIYKELYLIGILYNGGRMTVKDSFQKF